MFVPEKRKKFRLRRLVYTQLSIFLLICAGTYFKTSIKFAVPKIMQRGRAELVSGKPVRVVNACPRDRILVKARP